MKASKGSRRGTKSKLKRRTRDKFRVADFLRTFNIDDRVAVKVNPSSQKGMPHPRFIGKIGKVNDKRGNSYVVEVSVGNSKKDITVRPEHLKHVK